MASSMRKHDRVEKEPRQKQIDKINRFSYPKTMRELDSLAPSDFSENCPVLVAPDFSFIRSFTRADKKSLQIGSPPWKKKSN